MAQLGMPFGCVYTTAPMGIHIGWSCVQSSGVLIHNALAGVHSGSAAVYTRVLVECLHSEALRMHLEISMSARMTAASTFFDTNSSVALLRLSAPSSSSGDE